MAAAQLSSRAQFPEHLLLLLEAATTASSDVIRHAAMIQLQNHSRFLVAHGPDFFLRVLESLTVAFANVPPAVRGTCRKLANKLAFGAGEPLRDCFLTYAVRTLESMPSAGLIFASACMKQLSHPVDFLLPIYHLFCEATLPLLDPVIRSGNVNLLPDVYHMLARCLASRVPQILTHGGGLAARFVDSALRLCSQDIPVPLCEHCLQFLACVAMSFECSPAFLDLACHFGAARHSELTVSYSEALLYRLLKRRVLLDAFRERVEAILSHIALPQFDHGLDACETELASPKTWRSGEYAARALVVELLAVFDDMIPAFLAFVASREPEALTPAFLLMASIAGEELSPSMPCIVRLADHNRQAFDDFVEWALALLPGAGEGLRHAVLLFLQECRFVGLPMRFVLPILPLAMVDTDAISTAATLLPVIPDQGELAFVRDQLVAAAPALFDLFLTLIPAASSVETFKALLRLVRAIAPWTADFPPALITALVRLCAATINSDASAAIGIRAILRNLFTLLPVDLSAYVPTLARIAAAADSTQSLDAVLEMLCGAVRGVRAFHPDLWELVPLAFGVLARHTWMRLADVKDLIVNLIWRGAEHIGPVMGDILAGAAQACGEWPDPGTYASWLEIVAAIGRCVPAAVEEVVMQGIAFAESEDGDEVRDELSPFLEYVAVQYPREVVGRPRILAMLLDCGRAPGVLVAVMAVAPLLSPDVRAVAIAEAQQSPEINSEDCAPKWYDRRAVAEQFFLFLAAEVTDPGS
jgi:hypothetical protein